MLCFCCFVSFSPSFRSIVALLVFITAQVLRINLFISKFVKLVVNTIKTLMLKIRPAVGLCVYFMLLSSSLYTQETKLNWCVYFLWWVLELAQHESPLLVAIDISFCCGKLKGASLWHVFKSYHNVVVNKAQFLYRYTLYYFVWTEVFLVWCIVFGFFSFLFWGSHREREKHVLSK